mgnify:CR=1 FL=1
MIKKPQNIIDFIESNSDGVVVRVKETKGSAPRESDALMIVDNQISIGTIGGGRLEYDAVNRARELLSSCSDISHLENYRLGPELGQCCGGVVTLSFDKLTSKLRKSLLFELRTSITYNKNVLIFGAGHVGKAIIDQLRLLSFNCKLVDTRANFFVGDEYREFYRLTALPENEIRKALPGTAYVMVTHDHALDFLLVKEALSRQDSPYVGMIGSKTKKNQLLKWLRKEGVDKMTNLVSPIGTLIANQGFSDKRPEAIACLTVAEILLVLNREKIDIEATRKIDKIRR